MPEYLIEVPHSDDKAACIIAWKTFYESGSHFLANASWGCPDNDHRAMLTVDVDSKEQALQIVPPAFRREAKITTLMQVTKDMAEDFLGKARKYMEEHNVTMDEYIRLAAESESLP